MPELKDLLARFEGLDPALIAIGIVGLLVLILLIRKPKERAASLQKSLR